MNRAQVETYLKARSVEVGDCWAWQCSCTGEGHPVASIGGKRSIAVRRWAWQHWHRKDPGRDRIVLTCGTPKCVNPEHLQRMTPSELNRWLGKMGRMSTPAARIARARNAQRASPLTMEDARAIRARRAAGEKLVEIAKDYPVGLEAISRICLGKSWVDYQANPWARLGA